MNSIMARKGMGCNKVSSNPIPEAGNKNTVFINHQDKPEAVTSLSSPSLARNRLSNVFSISSSHKSSLSRSSSKVPTNCAKVFVAAMLVAHGLTLVHCAQVAASQNVSSHQIASSSPITEHVQQVLSNNNNKGVQYRSLMSRDQMAATNQLNSEQLDILHHLMNSQRVNSAFHHRPSLHYDRMRTSDDGEQFADDFRFGQRRDIQVPMDDMRVLRQTAHANNVEDNGQMLINGHRRMYPQLSVEDGHALVKSVIQNGLIERLDTKTLEKLAMEYGLEQGEENNNELEDSMEQELNEEYDNHVVKPSTNEDANMSRAKKGDSRVEIESSKSSEENADDRKPTFLSNELIQNYKNVEQVLQMLMNSEKSLKKRGESSIHTPSSGGPQLSIDSALTVLRQRLLFELARRKIKENENQIAINQEILKQLGRRRRRSVDYLDDLDVQSAAHGYDDQDSDSKSTYQPKSSVVRSWRKQLPGRKPGVKESRFTVGINCDMNNCKVNDLNTRWSNLHESLYNTINDNSVGGRQQQAQYDSRDLPASVLPPVRSHFRNNDKYIFFDKLMNDVSSSHNEYQGEVSSAQPLTYSNKLQRTRINSRKPSLGFIKGTTATSGSSMPAKYYKNSYPNKFSKFPYRRFGSSSMSSSSRINLNNKLHKI